MAQQVINRGPEQRSRRLARYKKYLPFYLFLLVPLIQVIIFNYVPMYGIVIAFKDFKLKRGILGSSWVGLKHFERIFSEKVFARVLGNTLRLSILGTLVTFPSTIVFALMMNEVSHPKFKRVTQTITYLPHFLSWVVVGNFVYQLMSPSYGVVNSILVKLGVLEKPVYFMIQKSFFTPIYLISSLWKELGWGIIIYLAAIAGIDPSLYESAAIDGAGRFRRMLNVTLPCIMPTISTLLILRMGSLVSVGFEPIFNLYNEGVFEVADVISTYVYRRGLIDTKYDYTTAIGLFQNVVSIILVLSSNVIARKADPDFRIL